MEIKTIDNTLEVYTKRMVALTPLFHGEIKPGRDREEKSNVSQFRRLPCIVKTPDGGFERVLVPCYSGNAVRGYGRRKLFHVMLEGLGLDGFEDFKKLFEGRVSAGSVNSTARDVWYFLKVGGLTDSGAKKKMIDEATYLDIKNSIPTLALFGGVMNAQHFEGAVRVGFIYPLVRELAEMFAPEKPALTLADVKTAFVGYTRRSEDDSRKNEGLSSEKMIFGCEVLPAGTELWHSMTLPNPSEGTEKAFKALAYLLSDAVLGGHAARGCGVIRAEYVLRGKIWRSGKPEVLDGIAVTREALDEFVEYVEKHRENILETIASIPETLIKTEKAGESK